MATKGELFSSRTEQSGENTKKDKAKINEVSVKDRLKLRSGRRVIVTRAPPPNGNF